MKLLGTLLLVILAFFPLAAIAQEATPSIPSPQRQPLTPEQAAQAVQAGGATCAACGTTLFVVIGVIIALNIALLVWVARDAKNRSMENPALWLILILFTHLIGTIVYLLARTKGSLVQCRNCNGKRLAFVTKCPHCQHL